MCVWACVPICPLRPLLLGGFNVQGKNLSEDENTSSELDKGLFNPLRQVSEAPSIGRRDQDRQTLPRGTGAISLMGMKREINDNL